MKFPESYRKQGDKNQSGVFLIPYKGYKGVKRFISIIASDGEGWEHVSVGVCDGLINQLPRCPFWDEMKIVKDLFWEKDDCVIQYHPPELEYINNHEFILHLWRPIGVEIPRPPKILVGI